MRSGLHKMLLVFATILMASVGLFNGTALAAVNWGTIYRGNGGYEMGGGDLFGLLGNSPPNGWGNMPSTFGGAYEEAVVNGSTHYIIQLDGVGTDINNGYLAVYPGNISEWSGWLNGNPAFVQQQLGNDTFTIEDTSSNGGSITLVPFAYLVSESGARFTGGTIMQPNGGTYDGYPTYTEIYHITPSSPPSANFVTASVSGSSVSLTTNGTDHLSNTLAAYHYDYVSLTNDSTGQVTTVAGSGDTNISQMQSESGSKGTWTDQFTASNLAPGNYTATYTIGDGVDRIASAVSTSFTVGGGGGSCPDPSSFGQSTYNATSSSQSVWINDPSGDTLSIGVSNGGSSSAIAIAGSQSVTIYQNGNESASTVAATDETNSACSTAYTTVDWPGTPPPSNQVTLSVSANPTSLPTGQATTVTGEITSGYQNGMFLDLMNQTTGQYLGIGVYGNYVSYTTTENTAQTDNFVAVAWPGSPAGSNPSYYSSPVAVTWTQAASLSATLTANPTTLQVNHLSTLSATAPYVPPGDYLVIWDLSDNQELNRSTSTGNNVTIPAWVNELSPTSQTYQAYIGPSYTSMSGAVAYSNPVTVTWTQPAPTIVLSANPTSLPAGQATTLTANVTSGWTGGNTMWLKIYDETTGQYMSGSWTNTYSTSYTDHNPGTETFIAYITTYEGGVMTNNAYSSNTANVTWTNACPAPISIGTPSNGQATVNVPDPNGDTLDLTATGGTLSVNQVTGSTSLLLTQASGASSSTVTATDVSDSSCSASSATVNWPLPPGPTSGVCPAPYDSNENWVNLGGGNQELEWTYNVPTPQYKNETSCVTEPDGTKVCRTYRVFVGCVDETTPMSQTYTHTFGNGVISGLSYDPGTPNYMWLPLPSSQWNLSQGPGTFWSPLDSAHGWTGFEQGGPDASQRSSNVTVNGQVFYTYGPGEGTQPWAYARPGSGFGIRMVWTGSPDALPQSGTVTYTLVNPDGSQRVWSVPLIVNAHTLQTSGTQLLGVNDPPPLAAQAVSAWTDLKKHTSNGELAAWSMSQSPSAVAADGAHVNVSVTVNTNAGSFTFSGNDVIQLFSYPAWYWTHLTQYQGYGN